MNNLFRHSAGPRLYIYPQPCCSTETTVLARLPLVTKMLLLRAATTRDKQSPF